MPGFFRFVDKKEFGEKHFFQLIFGVFFCFFALKTEKKTFENCLNSFEKYCGEEKKREREREREGELSLAK